MPNIELEHAIEAIDNAKEFSLVPSPGELESSQCRGGPCVGSPCNPGPGGPPPKCAPRPPRDEV